MSAEFAVRLTHNALLAISGDDAAAFLHGQFTNDVQALAPGTAQWNGWCSPKGRLLATFLLVRRAEDFLLLLPAEIAAAFAKRLAMYVLRSKVKIRDASAEHMLTGVVGGGAVMRAFGGAPAPMQAAQHGEATVIALDGQRFVVVSAANAAPEIAAPASLAAWELELVRAGIPVIVAATQDAFVPQMVNFELVGGVSFHKGCYPGQEIVARTQYRGILKRRMALAHVEGAAPQPGQAVYSSAFGDQAAGQVVNAAPAETGHDLLVVAQLESLVSGDLRLGAPDGPALAILSRPAVQAA